jgi:hypothetical protein
MERSSLPASAERGGAVDVALRRILLPKALDSGDEILDESDGRQEDFDVRKPIGCDHGSPSLTVVLATSAGSVCMSASSAAFCT